jgi:hypothetical protein
MSGGIVHQAPPQSQHETCQAVPGGPETRRVNYFTDSRLNELVGTNCGRSFRSQRMAITMGAVEYFMEIRIPFP